MKAYEDLSRREEEFQVGDLVFLKLQPYRQQSVTRRTCVKLAARFYGPFRVLQRIGTVAYKLQLPDTSHIHPVFHVSQLRRAIGSHSSCPTLPASLNDKVDQMGQPAAVLGVRQVKVDAGSEREVLIQWKDQPASEATWELYTNVQQLFPDFHLEDKVNVWAGGNAVNGSGPPIKFMYTRKPKPSKEKPSPNAG